jgi:hypothetical protein
MSGAMWPWPLALISITATFAGLLAWHQATLIDREREHWPRQAPSSRERGFILGALVTAVAAATVLQILLVRHFLH